MLVLLWGCFPFDPRTRVDELRVMAVQSEPAEISPAQSVDINVLIADPKSQGADVLVWPCTDIGEGCLEKEFFAGDISSWVQRFAYEEPVTTISYEIPIALSMVVEQLPEELIPFTGTVLWVLACIPDQCDAIAQYDNATLSVDTLSQPSTMLEGLDFGVASLARRSLRISNRGEEEKIQNPILTPLFSEALQQAPSKTMSLDFSYELTSPEAMEGFVSGYASAGYIVEDFSRGFGEDETTEPQTEATLEWTALETSEEGMIYVILEDGMGGLDFWMGEARIE